MACKAGECTHEETSLPRLEALARTGREAVAHWWFRHRQRAPTLGPNAVSQDSP